MTEVKKRVAQKQYWVQCWGFKGGAYLELSTEIVKIAVSDTENSTDFSEEEREKAQDAIVESFRKAYLSSHFVPGAEYLVWENIGLYDPDYSMPDPKPLPGINNPHK